MSANHMFIGVPLADSLYETGRYYQWQFDLNTHFRQITDPRDFHITMLFFGGYNPASRKNIWQDVRQTIVNSEKFPVTISRLNYFGKEVQPRVIFLEPENNLALNTIADTIQKTAYEHGFPREERPFKPHMTLAKKWRNKKHTWPDSFPSLPYEIKPITITAERISLFKIHPGREPKYEEVDVVSLKEPKRRQ